MKFKLNSFIVGFLCALIIGGILAVSGAFRRGHGTGDELLSMMDDPRQKERVLRKTSEFQKDALAMKLQAMAVRAEFARILILDRAQSEIVLNHQIAAISDFLDSETEWMTNYVTFELIEPVLRPTRERMKALENTKPEIRDMIEAYRKAKSDK